MVFGRESVPNPRFADEVSRIPRIGLDLLPELSDEHPQVLRLIDGVAAPDGLQDGAMGEHAVGVPRQERKQLELFRCEPNLFAAPHDASPVVVNRQITGFELSPKNIPKRTYLCKWKEGPPIGRPSLSSVRNRVLIGEEVQHHLVELLGVLVGVVRKY